MPCSHCFERQRALFIDEIFSVDAGMLHLINVRLQHIFLDRRDFGGIPVVRW